MKPTKRSRVARQRTRQLDEALSEVRVPPHPRSGWIGAVREALGMTKSQLARRIGISRPSLSRLEENEISGSITVSSLRKAAEGLGCTLQYVLVPRQSLSKMVREQALRRAHEKLGRINQSQALESASMDSDSLSQAVADLASELEIGRPADLWNE